MGSRQKSAESDQASQNAASDQVMLCLLTESSFKTKMQLKLAAQQPLNSR